MKLIDLDPHWLIHEGRRVGFIFECPTQRNWFQSVMFERFERLAQWELFEAAAPQSLVQGCSQGALWTCPSGPIEEATFETLSVYPSVDGSAGGMWHGWITNGEAA